MYSHSWKVEHLSISLNKSANDALSLACYSACNKTHRTAELRAVHRDNMWKRRVWEDEGSDNALECVGGHTGVGEEAWEFGEDKEVVLCCSVDDFG